MDGFVRFGLPFQSRLYPFERKYVTVGGAQIAYIDEGPRNAEPVLLLHGIPTWGFLYRNVVQGLLPELRCIVPDLPGYGMSDRIVDPRYYTLPWYIDTFLGFIDQLGLTGLTLVVHDLGGPIGLGVCADRPDRIKRLVILNTTNFPDAPLNWRVRFTLRRPIGELLFRQLNLLVNQWIPAEVHHRKQVLTEEVMAAYRAPFPDPSSRDAIAPTSRLIPSGPDHPSVPRMKKTNAALETLSQPVLVMWGDRDRLLRPWRATRFANMFRNCVDEVHFGDSGHYIQEDKPKEISARILQMVESQWVMNVGTAGMMLPWTSFPRSGVEKGSKIDAGPVSGVHAARDRRGHRLDRASKRRGSGGALELVQQRQAECSENKHRLARPGCRSFHGHERDSTMPFS